MSLTRKLAAILSADVVGYSRLMGEDERATLETLTSHRQVMRERITNHCGRVVDSPGDALLAEFPSAVEAVESAVEIQRQLARRNAGLAEHRRMLFRIGVNLGDVMEQDAALYGDGVNIAARLEALAEGGRICVSGTVFDQGDQVRIAAQLIDVQSGADIWAEKYDRSLSDIFAVQDEIASKIASTIASSGGGVLEHAGREIASRKRPDQLQAYDHVLRGAMTHGPSLWTKEGYRQAEAHIERAIELDPSYARARQEYAWLMLVGWFWRFEEAPAPPREIIQNAIRSVELDPDNPYAHRAAAWGYFFDKQMIEFEREARIAMDLAPNDAEVVGQMGVLFWHSGQWRLGVGLATKADNLNPVSAGAASHAVLFEDAYRRGQYQKALDMNRAHPVQGLLPVQRRYVAVYGELGDRDKAREHWNKILEIDPSWSVAKLIEHLRLWNFPEPLVQKYVESYAKAGFVLSQ